MLLITIFLIIRSLTEFISKHPLIQEGNKITMKDIMSEKILFVKKPIRKKVKTKKFSLDFAITHTEIGSTKPPHYSNRFCSTKTEVSFFG